jgi:hypothetical protein
VQLRPLVIALALVTACSREPRSTNADVPPQTSAATSASAATTVTAVFPSSTASAAKAPLPDEDPAHRQLRTAPITTLEIVSWSRPGAFHATIDRPNSEGPAHVTLTLALAQNPVAYRRPLAYARLSRALGMRLVPATVVRRVSTGELGAFFENAPDVRTYLSVHAAVLNDGTVDALLVAPSRGDAPRAWNLISRRDIVLDEAPEARAWARWAASAEPLPDENAAVLRDYVEALVLDYLAINTRRNVLLDEATSELMLVENDGAFPPKFTPQTEAHLLERLKPVVRFPRRMREVLTKFDRDAARSVFMPGTFETWLITPRTLMLLDERRMSLLTLIEARIAEYGEHIVLSL